MKYQTPTAFRTALEARLLQHSRQRSVPLIRLRKLVVFERLVARLMVVAPDRWVVKGGVALDFRFGEKVRDDSNATLLNAPCTASLRFRRCSGPRSTL